MLEKENRENLFVPRKHNGLSSFLHKSRLCSFSTVASAAAPLPLILFLQTYTDPKMPVPDLGQLKNMDAVLKLVIPALLTFVTVKFQGSSKSPFETHPVTVFFSIFALLLYCYLSLLLAACPPDFTTAWGDLVFRLLIILSFSLSIVLPTLLLFPGPSFWLLHLTHP